MLKRCVLFGSFFLVFNLYLKMTGYLIYEGHSFLYFVGQILVVIAVYLLGRRLHFLEIKKMSINDWLVYLSGFVAHLFSLGLTEFITVNSLAETANSDLDMYALPILLTLVYLPL